MWNLADLLFSNSVRPAPLFIVAAPNMSKFFVKFNDISLNIYACILKNLPLK